VSPSASTLLITRLTPLRLQPANWKAEQTVLLILGGWAVVIKGAMTYFGK
jgi:hypothetical protein